MQKKQIKNLVTITQFATTQSSLNYIIYFTLSDYWLPKILTLGGPKWYKYSLKWVKSPYLII